MYLKQIDDKDANAEEPDKFEILKDRIIGTMSRATILIVTEFVIVQSFAFVAKSGVNPGVMSIIFSSSIVFTPILFYCKYNQKL